MGLWNSKQDPPVAVPPTAARTFTNAPRHWPAVSFGLTKPAPADGVAAIIATIADPLAAQGATVSPPRTYIYDDGLLDVPCVVDETGTATAIFYYPTGGPEAAAHYAGVRQLLRTREGVAAVFYSPEAIGPAAPQVVLGGLEPRRFAKQEPPPADARYALWWPTPEDPSFAVSEDRLLLDHWFEALQGYPHVLLSTLTHALGVVEPEADGRPQLVGMPEDPFTLPMLGHGGVRLTLQASAAEGLVLSFDTATVTAAHRRTYLRLLARLADSSRAEAVRTKLQAEADDLSVANWRAARDEALEIEAAGQVPDALYVVQFVDGQIVADTTPTTYTAPPPLPAEDAAPPPVPAAGSTALAMPAQATLQFAAGLIETAAANLRDITVRTSTDDQLGQMNLSPTLVARVSGQLWRRTLVDDGGEDALAAAAAARDEWPDASVIAVVLDGAMRQGGTRVDCIRVLVQEGEAAAEMFWRYAAVDAGAIALYGRPGAQGIAPFVKPPQPPPLVASGFDHSLSTLAFAAYGYIQQSMAMEPADEAHAQRYATRPIKIPFAIVWDDKPTPTMCAFAMTGPHGATVACRQMLTTRPVINAVALAFDDVVTVDNRPRRRVRVSVQRRGMPAAAMVERHFVVPTAGTPFAFSDEPAFVRWADSLFG